MLKETKENKWSQTYGYEQEICPKDRVVMCESHDCRAQTALHLLGVFVPEPYVPHICIPLLRFRICTEFPAVISPMLSSKVWQIVKCIISAI